MTMRLSAIFTCFFMLLLSTISAQINYTREQIEKNYNTETIMLEQRTFARNGQNFSFNPYFPNNQLKEMIVKDGGVEAIDQFKQYRKALGLYWLATFGGLGGLLIIVGVFATKATAGFFLAYLLATLLLTFAIGYLGIKVYRHLARAIWYFNRNVLFKKTS